VQIVVALVEVVILVTCYTKLIRSKRNRQLRSAEMSSAAPKRSRFSENSEDVTTPNEGVAVLSAARIKEMMANAQKQIEERKKQLEQLQRQQGQMPIVPPVIPIVIPSIAVTTKPILIPTIAPTGPVSIGPTSIVPPTLSLSTPLNGQDNNKSRIAELTAQIQARLANRNLIPTAPQT
jgi:hypothetical protein